MINAMRNVGYFLVLAALFVLVGQMQSWNLALSILNLCIISAIMALGVNIQWGYAGLFNVGVMGFAALGGLAAMIISVAPVREAWSAGGTGVVLGTLTIIITIAAAVLTFRALARGKLRTLAIIIVCTVGYVITRSIFDPATDAIERVNPAATGYLGGLGLPIWLSWPVGGVLAAGAAWVIGKTALGLRSDYLCAHPGGE